MRRVVLFIIISFFITVEMYPQKDNVNVLVDSAIVLMENGILEESEALLESVISKTPNHYAANYELAYLMTEFYKNWIVDGKSKHDALELAKQSVHSHKEKGWDDPKYWAAFILLDALD